jgi:hypothetical protein
MTPITIGEVNTEVAPEGATEAGRASTPAGRMPWQELERARRTQADLAELRARTSAEGGFDG